ncbi:MAG: hypothetical protein ABW167_07830 [Baekduia sp.]
MDRLRAARLKFYARAGTVVGAYGVLASGQPWWLAVLFLTVAAAPVSSEISYPYQAEWPPELFPLPADVARKATWQTRSTTSL